jgi:hypothetical protein
MSPFASFHTSTSTSTSTCSTHRQEDSFLATVFGRIQNGKILGRRNEDLIQFGMPRDAQHGMIGFQGKRINGGWRLALFAGVAG